MDGTPSVYVHVNVFRASLYSLAVCRFNNFGKFDKRKLN